MPPQAEQYDELAELLTAMSDAGLSAPQSRRLAELMHGNPAAQHVYLDFVELHTMLAWQHREGEGRAARDQRQGLGTSVPSGVGSSQLTVVSGQWPVGSGQWAVCDDPPSALRPPPFSNPQSLIPNPSPCSVPLIVVDNTLPSPLSSLPLFLFSYTVATIIFGIAGLCGWLYQIEHYTEFARTFGTSPTAVEEAPPAVEKAVRVARVTGMVDCRWERKGLGIRDWGLEEGSGFRVQGSGVENPEIPKSPVRLGDKFILASGLLQLTYDSGAKVILQGPCTYEVDSAAGGFLFVGKLTARVEKRGERRGERGEKQVVSGQWSVAGKSNIQHPTSNISNPQSPIPNPSLSTTHYPLFTINTPTAVVTDLGTEFGVEVSKDGQTTSHVFRGSVRLQAASVNGAEKGIAQVIHENESARVEQSGGNPVIVLGPSAKPSDFVRKLVKPTIKTFDLVDVVAGGDGFSGRRNAGIDPTTGRPADRQNNPKKIEDYFVGDGKYHRVETLSFVDGVFIPDGRGGPVQIDSAGHRFDWFGATSNFAPAHIWALGEKPVAEPRTELGGVEYGSSGHGALHLPANNGITFDFDAIRRANPGNKLLRFRAVAGNTETAPESFGPVFADVWVLVDGQVRFRRREISSYNGAFSVVIPIGDNDRFLTLASTDGGNGIYWDSILFGDPKLEMAPTAVGQETSERPK